MVVEIGALEKQCKLEPDNFLLAKRLMQLRRRQDPEFVDIVSAIESKILLRGQFLIASQFPRMSQYRPEVAAYLYEIALSSTAVESVRINALKLMVMLHARFLGATLIELVKASSDDVIRKTALESLCRIEFSEAIVSVLDECLSDESQAVRNAALFYCQHKVDALDALLPKLLKLPLGDGYQGYGWCGRTLFRQLRESRHLPMICAEYREHLVSGVAERRLLFYQANRFLQFKWSEREEELARHCCLTDMFLTTDIEVKREISRCLQLRPLTEAESRGLGDSGTSFGVTQADIWQVIEILELRHWAQIPEQAWLNEIRRRDSEAVDEERYCLSYLDHGLEISQKLHHAILNHIDWHTILYTNRKLLTDRGYYCPELQEILEFKFEVYCEAVAEIGPTAVCWRTDSQYCSVEDFGYYWHSGAVSGTVRNSQSGEDEYYEFVDPPEHLSEVVIAHWPKTRALLDVWWVKVPETAFSLTQQLLEHEIQLNESDLDRFLQMFERFSSIFCLNVRATRAYEKALRSRS